MTTRREGEDIVTRARPACIREAWRRWPRAAWIIGDGRYASVAYCRVTTVILYATRAEAEDAKDFIDQCGCGGTCRNAHEIADLNTT